MNDKTIYNEPSDVDAEDGPVVVNGPDAVDVRRLRTLPRKHRSGWPQGQ